jgi:DNA-binding CsgD family transcriptional regulator
MPLDLTARRVVADIDAVSRSGLDLSTFLDEAIASIGRAVDHVGSCVATIDPSTLLLTSTLKYGDLRGRDELDHEWGLLEFGTEEPTSFGELAHRAVPAVATRMQDPSSSRLNDFMRPGFGYTDELRVVVRDRGQVWGGVALFRGADAPAFSEAEVELMAQLSAPLCAGLRAGMLTRTATGQCRTPDGPAVLIVDGDDRVQQYSAGAEAWLEEFLTSDTGTSPSGILAGLVGAARRYAAGAAARPPRCRVRSRSGMWMVLNASPMSPRGDVEAGKGDVVVTLDEARPPEIVPLVVAAFDLTQRERDVTQLVLQGLDTKDLAASMHLSRYTVQDHLKSIFEKAGVRSRRELIARIYFDQYVPRMGTELAPSGWFAAD